MYRFLVFSDLHLAVSKPFSRNINGYNSRLLDGMNILRQIREICINENIADILFCGDMFHDSSKITPDIMELLIKELKEFKELGIDITALTGQHDYYAMNGKINGINPLSDYMDVLHGCKTFPFFYLRAGINLLYCSWAKNIEEQKEMLKNPFIVKDMKNIFIGHFLVKELLQTQNLNYPLPCVEFKDLPQGCDLYLLGDYHDYIYIPELKLCSVGSTHHHTWGSKNKELGGCLIVEMDEKVVNIERKELEAPRFIEVFAKEIKNLTKRDFYRIIVDSEKEIDRLKKEYGDDYQIEFVVEKQEDIENNAERFQTSTSTIPEDIIKDYCDYMGETRMAESGLVYITESPKF